MKKVFFISNIHNKYLKDLDFLSGKLFNIDFYIIIRGKNEKINKRNYNNLNFIFTKNINDFILLSKKNKLSSLVIYGTGLYKNQYKKLFFKQIFEISHGYVPNINLFNKKFISNSELSEGNIKKILTIFRFFNFYGFKNTLLGIISEFLIKKEVYKKRFNLGILELLLLKETLLQSKSNINKKEILFIEEPFLSKLKKEEKKKFINFIDNFVELNKDYKIYFKLHPRSNLKDYKGFFTKKNIYIKKGNIFDFLDKSNIVIGFLSTPIIFGFFLRKKVFIIDPFKLYGNEIINVDNIINIQTYNKAFNVDTTRTAYIEKSKLNKLIFDLDKFYKLIF